MGDRINIGPPARSSGIIHDITGFFSFEPAPAEVFAWNMATGQTNQYNLPAFNLNGAFGPATISIEVAAPINNGSADVTATFAGGALGLNTERSIDLSIDSYEFDYEVHPAEHEVAFGLGGALFGYRFGGWCLSRV